MIRNIPNFIPARFATRPKFYTDCFGRVIAVFEHPTTHTNVMLEVNADIWNHRNPRDARGKLELEYQGRESRHIISGERFDTVVSAMRAVEKVLADDSYGKNYADKPVPVQDIHGSQWPDKVTVDRELRVHKAYRRANPYRKTSIPFVLTDADKAVLKEWGHPEDDFPQIEEAANLSIYDITVGEGPEHSGAWDEAERLLGREKFLSGISRSAFHWTSERKADSPDGKVTVYFDSGTESPFRKHAGR